MKLKGAVVPPPGLGFVTVTGTAPPVETSAAGIAALSCVVLTNVVSSALPLNLICEVATKFVPLTVKVKANPPAECNWPRDASVGSGLLMLNVATTEDATAGAGLFTMTLAVPPVAMSVAGTVTWIWVAVVDAGFSPLSAPKSTVAPLTKPLPVMVSVKAAEPAVAADGESEPITGCTF